MTIGEKLQQMKSDLVSLANRINQDGDTDTAMRTQQAICAVAVGAGAMTDQPSQTPLDPMVIELFLQHSIIQPDSKSFAQMT